MMTSFYHFIHCCIFLSLITVIGVTSLTELSIKNTKTLSILNGAAARTIENEYDNTLFIKNLGINVWTAIEYTLFNEGKKGLVIGNKGWLFTAEEFDVSAESAAAFEKNIALIQWVNQLFKQKGVTLVVVPVPAKARLYSEMLDQIKPQELHENIYAQLVSTLNEHAVYTTDSLAAMRNNKALNRQYLRTDTHWTPEGAQTVALETARLIHDLKPIKQGQTKFTTKRTATQEFQGDLLRYLPLRPWFTQLLPETETLTRYETYSSNEAAWDDLFTDNVESIALIGTSYSANPNWNFLGALKQAIQSDIINYAEAGNGPFKPMMDFLSQFNTEMAELELVIWEIPERYLLVPYEELYALKEAYPQHSPLLAQTF